MGLSRGCGVWSARRVSQRETRTLSGMELVGSHHLPSTWTYEAFLFFPFFFFFLFWYGCAGFYHGMIFLG